MKILFLTFFFLTFFSSEAQQLPEGFVHVKEVVPDIVLEMRYFGKNNFTGRPIPGYEKPTAILTEPAAKALAKVQEELENKGYCLKIFDAYRPQRAVNSFVDWARAEDDTLMKGKFYPEVAKKDLFSLGYIASQSGHSRGSTVDLTIIDAETQEELDMGSPYDLFDPVSHHNASVVTAEQLENRQLLKNVMEKYGFVAYPKEWWHYTYKPEPFPETYFDFPVK